MSDPILQQVTAFADKAHGEQQRKYTPERYIEHPLRVMRACSTYTSDTAILAAALLHDVLEDTPVTEEQIRVFLSGIMGTEQAERVVRLVVELTDVYVKEKYPKWNRRKRKTREQARMEHTSADAQTIKYADIMDNCTEIVSHDPEFAGVFLRECRALLKRMTKGDPRLYREAVNSVEDRLRQLGTAEADSGSLNI